MPPMYSDLRKSYHFRVAIPDSGACEHIRPPKLFYVIETKSAVNEKLYVLASMTRDFSVPPGSLEQFLRSDFRKKVFLVTLSVFEDRWVMQTVDSLSVSKLSSIRGCMNILVQYMFLAAHFHQNKLRDIFMRSNVPSEASWMFYILQVLLHVVGFEGNNAKDIAPPPLEQAKLQADVLFWRCSENYLVRSAVSSKAGLDYPEYDIHRVISHYFPMRWDPSSYSRIPIKPSIPALFVHADYPNFWSDTCHVLEASLIALGCTKTRTAPIMDRDGKVTHVDPHSIDCIVAKMVSSSKPTSTDARKGSRSSGNKSIEFIEMLRIMSFHPLSLRRELYNVVEAHVIIVCYSLQALFLDKDEVAMMMEKVVWPSIYLLTSRLRSGNEWIDARTLNVTEQVLLRDSVQCIVDILASLHFAPPSDEQVAAGAGNSCRRPCIRYSLYLGLSDLLLVGISDPAWQYIID
ncbi:hypothetical protein C8R45DRAFT_1146063 [Mycena sanguinolenta]|nr:hypothetical protein C8R45DRAFT_1146063 [Mycena sanguinolenta]